MAGTCEYGDETSGSVKCKFNLKMTPQGSKQVVI